VAEQKESPAQKIIRKLEEKEEKEWKTDGIKVSVFKDSKTMANEIADNFTPGKDVIIIPPPEKPPEVECTEVLLVLIGEYEGQDTERLGSLLEDARIIVGEVCRGITKYVIFYAAAWNAVFYAKEFKGEFDRIEDVKEIWLKMPFTKAVRLK